MYVGWFYWDVCFPVRLEEALRTVFSSCKGLEVVGSRIEKVRLEQVKTRAKPMNFSSWRHGKPHDEWRLSSCIFKALDIEFSFHWPSEN